MFHSDLNWSIIDEQALAHVWDSLHIAFQFIKPFLFCESETPQLHWT